MQGRGRGTDRGWGWGRDRGRSRGGAPPRDHLACGLSDCLSSSRSAVQVPLLVYELTAGQVGSGSAWKLCICCAAATRVFGTRVVFAIPLSGEVLVVLKEFSG